MTTPSLTVLMAFQNGLPYLPVAVESILGQSFTDFEFVLIDDHSTDGSRAYIESLTDSRIRLFSNAGKGLTSALNYGLEQSKGEWIARMDSDDWSFPTRLARQFEKTREPNTILISADYWVCDEDLNPVAEIHLCLPNPKLLTYIRKKNNPLCHPVMMFHRASAMKAGGYRFERAQDYDLWLRLLELGDLKQVEGTMLKYRVRRQAISIQHVQEQTASRRAIQGAARARGGSGGSTEGAYNYRLGFAAWLAGHRGAAARYLFESLLRGNNVFQCLSALLLMILPRQIYLSLAGYRGVYKT